MYLSSFSFMFEFMSFNEKCKDFSACESEKNHSGWRTANIPTATVEFPNLTTAKIRRESKINEMAFFTVCNISSSHPAASVGTMHSPPPAHLHPSPHSP